MQHGVVVVVHGLQLGRPQASGLAAHPSRDEGGADRGQQPGHRPRDQQRRQLARQARVHRLLAQPDGDQPDDPLALAHRDDGAAAGPEGADVVLDHRAAGLRRRDVAHEALAHLGRVGWL